MESELN
jgi:hypothetical protein